MNKVGDLTNEISECEIKKFQIWEDTFVHNQAEASSTTYSTDCVKTPYIHFYSNILTKDVLLINDGWGELSI